QAQRVDELLVALEIRPAEVVEEPAALADHHQKATPRGVVVRVHLEVVVQVQDAAREQRDLNVRRPGITRVYAVFLDDGARRLSGQGHPSLHARRGAACRSSSFSLSLFVAPSIAATPLALSCRSGSTTEARR